MLRHVLPGAVGPIVVQASLLVAASIITESGLSYLGYGVQPPTATWGNMAAQGLYFSRVWEMFLASAAIAAFALSANVLADAAHDALDPRRRLQRVPRRRSPALAEPSQELSKGAAVG